MILVLEKILKTSSLICPENAKKINKIIVKALGKNEKVTIDFSNINTVSIAFLYLSFKDLKKYYKNSLNLNEMITIKNPTSFLYDEIEYLKKNYKELAKKLNKFENENEYVMA
ncbi:MAG: STAS-like domain-containing protein [Fusobacteriaceae bacterium]|nr:STAS-like domain-containing protein [Fusobacteriaceae bacterium]MBP6322379.1 STAS-like domain-containing protein [Fusobacteriaceae bacterium]MBP9510103.1 STAS-like domain-containing protein [Fusobacteriaceae bacterium]